MPYKLSKEGRKLVGLPTPPSPGSRLALFTPLQRMALGYLLEHEAEHRFIESSEIARFYSLAPQAMRGPCASLYQQGLIEKEPYTEDYYADR